LPTNFSFPSPPTLPWLLIPDDALMVYAPLFAKIQGLQATPEKWCIERLQIVNQNTMLMKMQASWTGVKFYCDTMPESFFPELVTVDDERKLGIRRKGIARIEHIAM